MKMQGICMYKYVSKFQIYIRGHAHTQHIQFLYSNICKSNNFEVFALRKLENCCPKRLQSVSPLLALEGSRGRGEEDFFAIEKSEKFFGSFPKITLMAVDTAQ